MEGHTAFCSPTADIVNCDAGQNEGKSLMLVLQCVIYIGQTYQSFCVYCPFNTHTICVVCFATFSNVSENVPMSFSEL